MEQEHNQKGCRSQTEHQKRTMPSQTMINSSPKDNVLLREMTESDLSIFFEQQLDPQANYMAAFTSKKPKDREAFNSHWEKIRADATIIIKTILFEGKIAGYILIHSWFGEPELAYWLGKEFWGKGIATLALATFIEQVTIRPLYGHAARDNFASIRVMQKCGFVVTGVTKGYSNARQAEIEEIILKLDR